MKEIPGGRVKLKENSGSLKFHIHSIKNFTWKRRFAKIDCFTGDAFELVEPDPTAAHALF